MLWEKNLLDDWCTKKDLLNIQKEWLYNRMYTRKKDMNKYNFTQKSRKPRSIGDW